MARVIRSRTIRTSDVRRPWRITLDYQLGLPPAISVQMETVALDELDKVVATTGTGFVRRPLTEVDSETVTIAGGVTLTVGQLVAALEQLADRWDLADEAAAAAVEAAAATRGQPNP